MTQSVYAQKSYDYVKSKGEIKGKRTVYTEININAPSEEVKKTFLEFSKWSDWCKAIPQIQVFSGDINNLESKPKLELTLDFGRKKDPQKGLPAALPGRFSTSFSVCLRTRSLEWRTNESGSCAIALLVPPDDSP